MTRPSSGPYWARRDVVWRGTVLGATLGTAAGRGGRWWPLASDGRQNGHQNGRPGGRPGDHQARGGSQLDPMVVIDGTDVRALALRALDAAKAAGASYADVHLTRQLKQIVAPAYVVGLPAREGIGTFGESEGFGVGVRVRVGGAWGFAASPYWTPEEVAALAQEAVVEARANARGTLPAPEWTPIPVAQGHWATPIKVDPFVVTIEEKLDQIQAWQRLAYRYRNGNGTLVSALFHREERAVATSEGSYFTQTLYRSGADFNVGRSDRINQEQRQGIASAQGLPECAAGWELLTEADLPGQIPRLYEEADPRRHFPLPTKPGDVGRYDIVVDAHVARVLLEQTLGGATQLDVALGHEANAGGTSYLGPDPLALLGSYQAASSLVTVTANRSMPRGLATVKWDAEGVEPEDFTLVKDGVLVDYQTTRELAPVLAPWYQKQGKPVRSHGCAWAQDATLLPMQYVPNLVLAPGTEDVGFDDLVASTKKGLAVISAENGRVLTDFQWRTGEGRGYQLREISNGKLGPVLTGLSFLFESTHLWKNVVALGGPKSVLQYAGDNGKGQPPQGGMYSVRAVPLKIKDVDFIDPTRKA